MTILISFFAVSLLAHALIDGLRIRYVEGLKIDHDEAALLSLVYYLFWSVCISLWQDIPLYHLIAVWLFIPAARWLLHDLVINITVGLPWDYVGTTARLDRWLRRQVIHPIVIKVAVLAASIYISILIYEISTL